MSSFESVRTQQGRASASPGLLTQAAVTASRCYVLSQGPRNVSVAQNNSSAEAAADFSTINTRRMLIQSGLEGETETSCAR